MGCSDCVAQCPDLLGNKGPQHASRRIGILGAPTADMYDFPEYRILKKTSFENCDRLDVELIRTEIPACPKCGGEMRINSWRQIYIRDVNIGHKRIAADVSKRKFRCLKCNAFPVERLPHVNEAHKMTDRLVKFIEDAAILSPYAVVARDLVLDSKTVRLIFDESARMKVAARNIVTPRIMGIDEVRLGAKTYGVVVNIEAGTIVEMFENRKEETVRGFFEGLSEKSVVESVSMDAWETYRRVVRDNLECRIVVDHFHAVDYAQRGMKRARKFVRYDLEGWKNGRMTNDSKLLLANRNKLSLDEITALEKMLSRFPLLRDCYEILDRYRKIWHAQNSAEADARIQQWQKDIKKLEELDREEFRFFKKTSEVLSGWRKEILAYFVAGESNAMTESLNGKIRTMFRNGNGYSFHALRRKVLLAHGEFREKEKLKIPRPPRLTLPAGAVGLATGFNSPAMGFHGVPALLWKQPDFGINPEQAAKELSVKWDLEGPEE